MKIRQIQQNCPGLPSNSWRESFSDNPTTPKFALFTHLRVAYMRIPLIKAILALRIAEIAASEALCYGVW